MINTDHLRRPESAIFVFMRSHTWMVGAGLFALFAVMSSNACKHGQCDVGPDSKHGGSRSHNAGKNCQSCHLADGPGEGCWEVAGTAYDSLSGGISPDVVLRLYTQPNDSGELKLTLEGEALGNFYTSKDPGLGAGLYPSVTSANGHTSRMQGRVTSGACNSCHGVSTEKIRVH